MESINQSPRSEIKKLLIESLSQKLSKESGQQHDTPTFNNLVESHAEQILTQYEQSVISSEIRKELKNSSRGFWYGTGQSILGSFIFLFIIGALLFVFNGFKFNFLETFSQAAQNVDRSMPAK